jgi:uncharacterized integral membrane protein
MIIFFLLGLLLGAIAVTFALQNIAIITVTLFVWHMTGSLALVLAVAMIIGVIITLLFILPESIQSYFRYRSLKKQYDKLKGELDNQKKLAQSTINISATPDLHHEHTTQN